MFLLAKDQRSTTPGGLPPPDIRSSFVNLRHRRAVPRIWAVFTK